MATALPRTTVTHVPRVQRLLDAGNKLFPGKSDREVLLDLAERGLASTSPRGVAGLMVLPGPGRTVTTDELEAGLLDD